MGAGYSLGPCQYGKTDAGRTQEAYRPEFINRIDESGLPTAYLQKDMQEVVKVMVKPLIASLAEKGIELKFQAN